MTRYDSYLWLFWLKEGYQKYILLRTNYPGDHLKTNPEYFFTLNVLRRNDWLLNTTQSATIGTIEAPLHSNDGNENSMGNLVIGREQINKELLTLLIRQFSSR